MSLTQEQIERFAAKLRTNGLPPNARVFHTVEFRCPTCGQAFAHVSTYLLHKPFCSKRGT